MQVGVISAGIVDLVSVSEVSAAWCWERGRPVRTERVARMIVSTTCVSGWVIKASLILGEDV